jgi:hypothetical protein
VSNIAKNSEAQAAAPTPPAAPYYWRSDLPVHPICAAYPELSCDELIALGKDIKANGLRMPIVVHERKAADAKAVPEFELLDGRSRLDAMVAVGIKFKIGRGHSGRGRTSRHFIDLSISDEMIADAPGGNVQIVYDLNETEIKALVDSLNAHRRHLTAKAKRAAIERQLKADPEKSNRQIAAAVGADHTTVAAVRQKTEATGGIPQLTKTKGKDGKARPTRKPKPAVEPESTTPPPITTGAANGGTPANGDDSALDAAFDRAEARGDRMRAKLAEIRDQADGDDGGGIHKQPDLAHDGATDQPELVHGAGQSKPVAVNAKSKLPFCNTEATNAETWNFVLLVCKNADDVDLSKVSAQEAPKMREDVEEAIEGLLKLQAKLARHAEGEPTATDHADRHTHDCSCQRCRARAKASYASAVAKKSLKYAMSRHSPGLTRGDLNEVDDHWSVVRRRQDTELTYQQYSTSTNNQEKAATKH